MVQGEQENGVDWIRMSVSDSGIGIPPDKIDHVFDEFSQADETTTRDYGGTGLGLPISRRFCQMMGGNITVESTVGEGSTFIIRLPLEVAEESEAAEDESM
jgi:signal transduction histidine kinase